MNFLLPKRAALVATPLVRKRYADMIRRRAEERETEKQMQAGAVQAVSGKTVTFSRKVTKTGKLYAAITEKLIVDALKDQHSIDLKEDDVQMEHIKTTGTHSVTISMAGQSVPLTVTVEAEKK